MRSDSIRETIKIGMTTKGMVFMNLPIIPLTKTSGRKAATVVSTEKITGRATSIAPSIDEAIKGFPMLRCV